MDSNFTRKAIDYPYHQHDSFDLNGVNRDTSQSNQPEVSQDRQFEADQNREEKKLGSNVMI